MARPARARGCAPGVGARARAMPAPSDSSVRRLLCLGVLPLLLRRASAQCSSIVEPVTALEGAISAPDVLRDGTCAWMLMARGHNQYESLKLTNNGVRLIGSSRLLLCSPQIVYNINGEGHVQCHQPEVALYSALSPMPSEISITHVDHVMIVFPTDPENGTAVHISFEWVEAGFTMTFWPIAIVIGISLLGTCVSAALLYLMCFIRGRIRNRNSASGTLAQRQQEKERRTMEALGALPTCTWKEEVQGNEDHAECCLCLEAYEPDQPIRTLPCKHFFHQNCIDNWFAARKFTLRTCPLCKRDPVPNLNCDEEEQGQPSVAQEAVEGPPPAAVAVADEPNNPDQPQATEIGRHLVIEI
ncbi:unnamed protein product [Prorocentrum cordatum]|uniref:RING-type domain-containing protein n=1 Tax=Prorocentrum cordatum TaxID=2364126 RepID=A0ABN9SV75_9DINO|nr:unnamed protein product [Polarella glacialis]